MATMRCLTSESCHLTILYSRTLILEILILEDGIDEERPHTFLRILCPSHLQFDSMFVVNEFSLKSNVHQFAQHLLDQVQVHLEASTYRGRHPLNIAL